LGYRGFRLYAQEELPKCIFDAIDRYLTGHPTIIEETSAPPMVVATDRLLFVDPPMLLAKDSESLSAYSGSSRKFDPVERDHQNRSLGKAGEAFVVDIEPERD